MTHASSVIPVDKLSEDDDGIVTQLFVPLNDRAPPNSPLFTHVALVQVGADTQEQFISWAAAELLPALRPS